MLLDYPYNEVQESTLAASANDVGMEEAGLKQRHWWHFVRHDKAFMLTHVAAAAQEEWTEDGATTMLAAGTSSTLALVVPAAVVAEMDAIMGDEAVHHKHKVEDLMCDTLIDARNDKHVFLDPNL